MARPKKAIPTVRKWIYLPVELAARLDMLLYSEVEARIPYSALTDFVTPLIEQALDKIQNEQKA